MFQKIYQLASSQMIHTDLETCWSFFSNPRNLAKITPPSLGFQILSDLPQEIYPGLMIEYRVRPLFGLPTPWLTEITHVERLKSFIDEQRIGPYQIWHHEHRFEDLGDGRIQMHDTVTYVLPFSPWGEWAHPILVKPQLNKIFSHREKVVGELFAPSKG